MFTDRNLDFEQAAQQDLLREGMPLSEYVPKGGTFDGLSPFVPMQTFQLVEGSVLPDAWVGVSLRSLFKPRGNLRSFLRASPNATVLGVLNAPDDEMERLWALGADGRQALFRRWVSEGMTHITGPTFSVYSGQLAMERLSQLHRHHRVAEEAERSGLVVAPNIYVHNTHGLRQWRDWLGKHTALDVVSREVSFGRSRISANKSIAELLRLLDEIGRPFHVLLVGVGPSLLRDVRHAFRRTGHTFSILTKTPIIKGLKGRPLIQPSVPLETPQGSIEKDVAQRLALSNLAQMRRLANRMAPKPTWLASMVSS